MTRLTLCCRTAAAAALLAAALLGLALLIARSRSIWAVVAGWLFVAGLVLFCGGLDLVTLGAPAWLTALVPWGGTAFILGWIALLVAALRPRPAA
jgi:uncharacterized membrane protein YgdD (TMEM256/DUF423 family)